MLALTGPSSITSAPAAAKNRPSDVPPAVDSSGSAPVCSATAAQAAARSDPAVLYARDLIKSGHIGEVLTAHLNASAQAVLQRGPGRIWQGVRANPRRTARDVRSRFRDLDRRLADVETYVTSSDNRLAREIEQLR